MPKTTNRLFLNLLRSFGVIGAGGGDELSLPLSGSVAPVILADEYDPATIYGFTNVIGAGGVGNVGFIEIQAKKFARLIALSVPVSDVAIRRRSAFTAGGAPAAAVTFSSDGSLPRATFQNGNGAAAQGGALILTGAGFPPIHAIHWEGVLRIESTVANAAFTVSGFFQEQRLDDL